MRPPQDTLSQRTLQRRPASSSVSRRPGGRRRRTRTSTPAEADRGAGRRLGAGQPRPHRQMAQGKQRARRGRARRDVLGSQLRAAARPARAARGSLAELLARSPGVRSPAAFPGPTRRHVLRWADATTRPAGSGPAPTAAPWPTRPAGVGRGGPGPVEERVRPVGSSSVALIPTASAPAGGLQNREDMVQGEPDARATRSRGGTASPRCSRAQRSTRSSGG
jgi:hypothetical protein